MKTIFISVPNGYYARNILVMDVIGDLLSRKFRIVILSPAYQEDMFVSSFPIDPSLFFVDEFEYHRNGADNLTVRLLKKICCTFENNRAVFLPSMSLLWKLKPTHLYSELFNRYKPDLVITFTCGVNDRDIPLIREAKRNNIRSVCIVHSWDNLRSKGIFLARTDKLAVWNELMKDEAIHFHHYKAEDVFITGPIHFDVYQDPSIYISRDEFFSKLGLDKNKSLVTVSAMSYEHRDNAVLVRLIEEGIKKREFVEPLQILFRPHPLTQVKQAQELKKLEEKHQIKVDCRAGSKFSPTIKWIPTREDMIHLANTIKHSDVMVNVASTLTLEAAILDTPVVNIGFCPHESRFFRNATEVWPYAHYKHVLDRKGAAWVKSPKELIDSINQYLKDPSTDRVGRQKIARDICYKQDGQAHVRIREVICGNI